MAVIEELQAVLGHHLARFVEDRRGLAAGLFVEVALVRNPGDSRRI